MSDQLAHLAGVTKGLEVWFPEELPEHSRRLMDALGVTVHIDPFAIRMGARS